MKVVNALLLIGFVVLMTAAVLDLAPTGDLNAPSHRLVNEAGNVVAGGYYIRHAYRDAATPNMVTAVLADYRGFDTLGETVVVVAAGIACILILRRRKS